MQNNNSQEVLYRVISPMLEEEVIIKAKNATQAKRKACHIWGINPSDAWHGISTMQAFKIKQIKREE